MPVKYPFTPIYSDGGTLYGVPEVSSLIRAAGGPIVEIGGPTLTGYSLLGTSELLPATPMVSNLTTAYGPQGLDLIYDAKTMPFADSSIGMFLARCIAVPDYFAHPSVNQELLAEHAEDEYQLFEADSTFAPVYNLRLGILKEMHRAISSGGIILFERLSIEDIDCAKKIGLLAVHTVHQGDSYDVVLQAN